METRLCTNCDTEKDLSSFQLAKKKRRDGTRYECRLWTCNACEWEKKKARKATKDYDLQRKYGITIETYNDMFEAQEGCCDICETHQSNLTRALAVDHCHDTGKVRGLLCGNCNIGIGNLQDSIKVLKKATKYLRRHR